MKKEKYALIIFVRNPEPGKVKTRLAATIGHTKALAIYKELLRHTFDIAALVDADKFVFYSSHIETDDCWNTGRFYKALQSNGDLGIKMQDAFTHVFENMYNKAVIIGSDCYELTTPIIENAFSLLDKHDAVIGPARDGGYYLLGMKKNIPALFHNKEWSTGAVYRQTISDLENGAISYANLPVLADVDTAEDIPGALLDYL